MNRLIVSLPAVPDVFLLLQLHWDIEIAKEFSFVMLKVLLLERSSSRCSTSSNHWITHLLHKSVQCCRFSWLFHIPLLLFCLLNTCCSVLFIIVLILLTDARAARLCVDALMKNRLMFGHYWITAGVILICDLLQYRHILIAVRLDIFPVITLGIVRIDVVPFFGDFLQTSKDKQPVLVAHHRMTTSLLFKTKNTKNSFQRTNTDSCCLLYFWQNGISDGWNNETPLQCIQGESP